jgi:putative ABC transport system substrate-binding protein
MSVVVAAASRPAHTGGGPKQRTGYGPNRVDTFRRAATYVDRILRGAKPAELPVQLPTKFEMVVNLKTVKALDLTVPQSIPLQAEEVIEWKFRNAKSLGR